MAERQGTGNHNSKSLSNKFVIKSFSVLTYCITTNVWCLETIVYQLPFVNHYNR